MTETLPTLQCQPRTIRLSTLWFFVVGWWVGTGLGHLVGWHSVTDLKQDLMDATLVTLFVGVAHLYCIFLPQQREGA